MSAKRADVGSKAVNALAGMAAGFLVRKVLIFAWTKARGEAPPEHPEDPDVALVEALAWGIVLGVGVQTTRLLVSRATGRHALKSAQEAEDLSA
jgi:hypothetical protein